MKTLTCKVIGLDEFGPILEWSAHWSQLQIGDVLVAHEAEQGQAGEDERGAFEAWFNSMGPAWEGTPKVSQWCAWQARAARHQPAEHGARHQPPRLTSSKPSQPIDPLERGFMRLVPKREERNMGCDIHSHAEKRDGDRWVSLDVEAFKDCNYRFFGWLANVRNYSGMTPIAAGRGFPATTSAKVAKDYEAWSGDAHSASWVSVAELLAVDYGEPVEDRRTTVQLGSNSWTGSATCSPGEGRIQTLREFLGPGFFVVLKRLQDSDADRVVFWFDN